MTRSSKQMIISLDQDTAEQLDGVVDKHKIPRSCVITLALRQFFEREKANANTFRNLYKVVAIDTHDTHTEVFTTLSAAQDWEENLWESPENPVASARGCRGGEMPIPSATRHAALANGRWRMDEVANKFLASSKTIIAIFDIFMWTMLI